MRYRTMKATVVRMDDVGVFVRTRRNPNKELLYYLDVPPGLLIGDKVLVYRQPNNPYLRFARKAL